MILVWSGWGILGVLVPVLFGVVGYQLAQAAGLAYPASYAALGVALSGLVVYALGAWLNGARADERVRALRERRAAELHHLVENGAYVRADGTRPTSLPQARAEAEQELEAQLAAVASGVRRHHSLFFVPLQWVGPLLVVGGIVVAFTQRGA